jgi:hypothetical protein
LRWVTEVSRGNPLYVRELVDGALESGTLVNEAGFWRLRGRPGAGGSLIELVEQRMAGLADAQRETVELLALGEPLKVDELMRLSSEPAVLDVEALGLLELRGEQVGLSHSLLKASATRRSRTGWCCRYEPSRRTSIARCRSSACAIAGISDTAYAACSQIRSRLRTRNEAAGGRLTAPHTASPRSLVNV